jgi:hypothetical protein
VVTDALLWGVATTSRSVGPVVVNLDGVRVKLARADALIEELRGHVDPIVAAVNSSIECEREDDGTTLVYRLTTVPVVPPEVPAIVGDVLHNARSALDHLAWQLVAFDGGTPNDNTAFPIHDSPTNAKGNPRVVNLNPPITHPALLEALERAQPFYGEATYGHPAAEHGLSVLRSLNNVDKHRLLLAVVCALNIHEPAWWGADDNDPQPSLVFTFGPLGAGSVIASFDFEGQPAPSRFDPHLGLTVSLMEKGVPWLNHISIGDGVGGLVSEVRRAINWGGFVQALGEQHV